MEGAPLALASHLPPLLSNTRPFVCNVSDSAQLDHCHSDSKNALLEETVNEINPYPSTSTVRAPYQSLVLARASCPLAVSPI